MRRHGVVAAALGAALVAIGLGCTGMVGAPPPGPTAPSSGTEVRLDIDVQGVVARRTEMDARKLGLVLGSDTAVRVSPEGALWIDTELLGSRVPPSILEDYAPGEPMVRNGRPQAVYQLTEAARELTRVQAHDATSETLRARLEAYRVEQFEVRDGDGPGEVVVRAGPELPVDLLLPLLTSQGRIDFLFSAEDPDMRVGHMVERARATLPPEVVADNDALIDALRSDNILGPRQRIVWSYAGAGDERRRDRAWVVQDRAVLSNEQIRSATLEFDELSQAMVVIEFDPRGTRALASSTSSHVGEQLVVVLDEVVLIAPVIHEPITSGKALVTMGASSSGAVDAARIAAILQGGLLPVPLRVASVAAF